MTGTNTRFAAGSATAANYSGGNPDYTGLFGNEMVFNGALNQGIATTLVTNAYTLTLLTSKTYTNNYSGANVGNIKTLINGSNGNLIADYNAVGAGSNLTVQDTTHSDSITAGQTLALTATFPNGAGTVGAFYNAVKANSTASTTLYVNSDFVSLGNSAGYIPPIGASQPANATEAATQLLAAAAGTLSQFSASFQGTLTVAPVLNSRVNTANGNQTITCVAVSALGVYATDSTHTDAIAAGSLFNSHINASNGVSTNSVEYRFTGSSSKMDYAAGYAPNWSVGSGTTYYSAFTGNSTTAPNFQSIEFRGGEVGFYSATLSNLRVGQSTTPTPTVTLQLRKNAANGNQTVTSVSATSGFVSDATHTDSVVVNDAFGVSIVTTGTTTFSTIAISINDGSNSGANSVTVGLNFPGVAFTSTGTDSRSTTATLAFSGLAFAGSAHRGGTTTATLAFSGVSFAVSSVHNESATATLAFRGVAFAALATSQNVTSVALHFGGITIEASSLDYPAPGSGRRSFWTFGA